MSSAPRIGYLKARLKNEDYFFDGQTWTGKGQHVEYLNAIRDEWDLNHYPLRAKAARALSLLFPATDWEILEVKPDMSDQAEPPSGEDEFW